MLIFLKLIDAQKGETIYLENMCLLSNNNKKFLTIKFILLIQLKIKYLIIFLLLKMLQSA